MILRGRRAFLAAGAAAGATLIGGAGALSFWRHLQRPKPETEAPEYHGREARLAEVLDAPPFDVCIVGSGFAGTALGTRLAQAGMRTLLIEAGVNPSQMGRDQRYALINQATMSGDHSYAVPATRALMPGGTSSLWTGNSARLPPVDFEHNAYTPAGARWPVTYAQMDRYYELAEDTLHVTGESNVRYVPPRTHPLHNERRGGNRALKSMLADADVVGFDTFRSRTDFGGPLRVARDLLPQYSKLPGTALLTGVSVRRLVTSSPDHIDSILVRNIDGDTSMIRAHTYVVAAGGVESARLLLLSRSEQFPNGLGNQHDQVGRTFADHLQFNFTGRTRNSRVLFGGPLPQVVRSFEFYEAFKRRGLGSLGLAVTLTEVDGEQLELRTTAECEIEPAASNRVTLDESVRDPWGDPVAHVHFSATTADRRTREQAQATVTEIMSRMGAQDIQEQPTHWGHHHIGTVRMGNDERTSVVDANLKLHGIRNAFVLTSGNFVTAGPATPTLLIVAFAHRLADHLIALMNAGELQSPLLSHGVQR